VNWSTPETVAGFASSPPNGTLMRFAGVERGGRERVRALDIGCGAARNAVPLAMSGWDVFGTDNSRTMLEAAARRRDAQGLAERLHLAEAVMPALPVRDRSMDLIVAHGIWNLGSSGDEFRQAIREAARAAKPGGALFLFTFSRNTLPPSAAPVDGEAFVFTQFAGEPQCFLTEEQLIAELGAVGFKPEDGLPLRELNRPTGRFQRTSGPVIWEGAFRMVIA
jgi:SAM-dependent methyltransferase